MTKTIVIIPARGGSKRLPNKNTLPLDGIPLVAHSILYAQANANIIDEIYISTDNPEIKNIAIEFGARVIDRPKALSDDHASTVSVLQHAIQSNNWEWANIVLLQPTNPLRPKNLLRECYQLFSDKQASGLFTVSKCDYKLGHIDGDVFNPLNYTPGQRTQDLAPLYFENGLLYISTAKSIGEGFIIGHDSLPFVVEHPFANIDIDTQAQFDYANFIVSKYGTEI